MNSFASIRSSQRRWLATSGKSEGRDDYTQRVTENLFREMSSETNAEFEAADGHELERTRNRPAKMCAAISSSALAVNFFDSWRAKNCAALAKSLGVERIDHLQFEYKPAGYPVGPRSPNLDVKLTCVGRVVGVESKFAEPFRSSTGNAGLAAKYFDQQGDLWSSVGLPGAQQLANGLRGRWLHLDVPQLLKHLLGLGYEGKADGSGEGEVARTLLYLWYDTGLPDAVDHREEVERFETLVVGDRVTFCSRTYQEVFGGLTPEAEPIPGWYEYMRSRYFTGP
ncbi:MAG: hypothetical protein AB7S39_13190 [Gemmatimonadales bacterium]